MIENKHTEYKQQITPEIEKEVVAFLNSKEGGIIYLGIDNAGNIVGIEHIDQVQLQLKDRLKNNILPSCMGLFDLLTEKHQDKNVLKIIVAGAYEKPYYIRKYGMSEKGAFIRIGSSSEPITTREIERLFAKRTRHSISNIKSAKQDLQFQQLHIYYQGVGKILSPQFAKNLELLTDDNTYNYVGYLMNDTNTISIKVAKYDGIDRVNLVESNEYGFESLVKATQQVLDKLNLENKTLTKITSKERKETRIWNEISLREAVVNAFVHNDYSRELAPKFELFDDRLEITSNGGLPEGLAKEEFFEGFSVPRNKEIMRIFKDLDLVEQLGSGIPRILEFYKKESFQFSENFLRIVLPRKVYEKGGQDGSQDGGQDGSQDGHSKIELTPAQDQVFRLIVENPKISRRELAENLKINESAIQKHINKLKEKKVIERVGKTNGYWEIIRTN
ncbi:RNA-binding domain-containing protein [Epilithonimonas hominis]|uniref:RNA-binding domain-containing protein n=2 Tax=Epilithonimonas hominis TaxID=420404 RepID=UPI002896F631|nr:RNA-binding domain-containing protein [Epilithonimonas hominis]